MNIFCDDCLNVLNLFMSFEGGHNLERHVKESFFELLFNKYWPNRKLNDLSNYFDEDQ